MTNDQLDRLDAIAKAILEGRKGAQLLVGPLSTGERVYVALAANDMTLAPGYTIVQAMSRLDATDELGQLLERWSIPF